MGSSSVVLGHLLTHFKDFNHYPNRFFKMKADTIFVILFKIGCFICTVYISFGIIKKYLVNEDTSVVSIKKFDRRDTRSYPALTICFHADAIESLYDRNYIFEKSKLHAEQYYGTLMGAENNLSLAKFGNVSFENAAINLTNYLERYKIEDTYDDTVLKWKHNNSTNYVEDLDKMKLVKNYQDPTRICYTFHPSYMKYAKKIDNVDFYFDLEKLQGINEGVMYFFTHNKDQFIRSMRYMHKQGYFSGITKNDANNYILFDLTHISIVKMRENANDPCNRKYSNDDEEWMYRTMKVIGCVPPYWQMFIKEQTKLKACTRPQELRTAASYLPYKNERALDIFTQYPPPCHRMRVLANTNKDGYKDPNLLKVKFRYR